MRKIHVAQCAFMALFVSGAAAQTSLTPTFLSAVSTGMAGLASSQTAQLNVVNMSSTPPTATAAAAPTCAVQLEFWDSQGKTIKSSQIANLAPGAAGALQIKLLDVTSAAGRTDVRGVVRTNPVTTTMPSTGSGNPQQGIAFPIGPRCNVMTTLEVFDTTTGVTQTLTSDTRPLQTFGIMGMGMATGR